MSVTETSTKQSRGFALISPDQRREIARLGGVTAHQRGTAHEFTIEEAREAGRKGGAAVSLNRAHMAAIGRKGGRKSKLKRIPDSRALPSREEPSSRREGRP